MNNPYYEKNISDAVLEAMILIKDHNLKPGLAIHKAATKYNLTTTCVAQAMNARKKHNTNQLSFKFTRR